MNNDPVYSLCDTLWLWWESRARFEGPNSDRSLADLSVFLDPCKAQERSFAGKF